jgi:arginine/lysine/histidine transport system ATP-binding protein
MTESVLKVEHLWKCYGATAVLCDVSMEVHKGEVIVLIGPSGSGKSTFLRCINRLIEPDRGRIWVSGREITSRETNLPKARRHIGFVAQHFNLYPHMTAMKNIMEGPLTVLRMPRKEAERKAMTLLQRVGLAEKALSYPYQLSGGQQQRVAIARALAMDPTLIMFDEPTSALDPELTGEVLDTMKQLADEGMTMIVVSHEMQFARRVANRVVMFDAGTIVEEGIPSEFFSHPRSDRAKRFLERLLSWEAKDDSEPVVKLQRTSGGAQ